MVEAQLPEFHKNAARRCRNGRHAALRVFRSADRTVFAMGFRTTGKQKEPACAREAVYLSGEVICEAPPLVSSASLIVPAFNWLRQCIRPWWHRDGFHSPRLGHRRAARECPEWNGNRSSHIRDLAARRHILHYRILRRSKRSIPTGPNRARQFQSGTPLRDCRGCGDRCLSCRRAPSGRSWANKERTC